MITSTELIYLIVVGLVGPIGTLVAVRQLKTVERRRKQSLKKRKNIRATTTDTPLKRPVKEIKAGGIENIEERFSIFETIVIILSSLLWIVLMIIPFLEKVPATLVSLFIGALALVASIGARPVVENFIAGVMITFNKPFKIGDTVLIDDHYGTIEDITTTHTILKIWDWRRLVIPNSQMILKEFINYTLNDAFIWKNVTFLVAYDTDLEQVKNISIEVAKASKHFVNYEEPAFWVMKLQENHYKCWVAAWSDNPAKAWELGNDIRSGLITAFQKEEIKAHTYHLDYIKPTNTKQKI